jgi:hypothetical protein
VKGWTGESGDEVAPRKIPHRDTSPAASVAKLSRLKTKARCSKAKKEALLYREKLDYSPIRSHVVIYVLHTSLCLRPRREINLAHFPFLESLHVDNYRLYPGENGQGLQASFGPGPWIILGVNGLGKSTLLLMLRYILVGSVRVRSAGFAGETRDLLSADPRMFASRVFDGAKNARAQLKLRIGPHKFVVTRRLENLAIESLSIDGVANGDVTEERYQLALTDAFEISDFANVVRLVDRLIFTFLENETALIWDTASQYEIFRALVLKQDDATRLRELEGISGARRDTQFSYEAIAVSFNVDKSWGFSSIR